MLLAFKPSLKALTPFSKTGALTPSHLETRFFNDLELVQGEIWGLFC